MRGRRAVALTLAVAAAASPAAGDLDASLDEPRRRALAGVDDYSWHKWPTSRAQHCAVSLSLWSPPVMVVYGGERMDSGAGLIVDDSAVLGDIWVYDTGRLEWAQPVPVDSGQIAIAPSGRYEHACEVLHSTATEAVVIVMGGTTAHARSRGATGVDELWELHLARDERGAISFEWRAVVPLGTGPERRAGHTLTSWRASGRVSLILVGGYSADEQETTPSDADDDVGGVLPIVHGDAWLLSPPSDDGDDSYAWLQLIAHDDDYKRAFHMAVATADAGVVVLGGMDLLSTPGILSGTLWRTIRSAPLLLGLSFGAADSGEPDADANSADDAGTGNGGGDLSEWPADAGTLGWSPQIGASAASATAPCLSCRRLLPAGVIVSATWEVFDIGDTGDEAQLVKEYQLTRARAGGVIFTNYEFSASGEYAMPGTIRLWMHGGVRTQAVTNAQTGSAGVRFVPTEGGVEVSWLTDTLLPEAEVGVLDPPTSEDVTQARTRTTRRSSRPSCARRRASS